MNSMRLRPPETPRRTGKPGAVTDGDNVHSGESFCVRVKAVRQLPARHDPDLAFPSEGCEAGARQ